MRGDKPPPWFPSEFSDGAPGTLAIAVKASKSNRRFLSLVNATFRLGDRLVFAGTSWTFGCDEHWAIIGPNGSGKSILGDALRGRLPLVEGELRYHFRPPPDLSPEEVIGHVSFEERKSELHEAVVQSRWTSFDQEHALQVREHLAYERVMDINPFEVTARHGPARRAFERRRRRAVHLLRIAPFLGRTLLSLSNGERQRVELARALCHPLRLLILDEPFAGLDAAMRTAFHHVVEQLMCTPLRVLLITTRLEDLPRSITHILCVDKCRIIAAGPKSEGRNPKAEGNPKTKNRKPEKGMPEPRNFRFRASAFFRPSDFGLRISPPARRRTPNPSRSPELLRLQNVTVRYGGNTILRNLNWGVRAGESWALLGPNGSGKTTLLSLLIGDNPQAYSNEVLVFGRQRGAGESIWDIKRRIGWVSPELHLHFNDAATCFEVVASGFRGTIGLFEPVIPKQRAAALRWLARFGLREFAATPLFALSAGLQRMVLLARALVTKSPLLILDEPCQGLDLLHRGLFVGTVDSLIRAGATTVIYVTHRPDEIPPSIKRVLTLAPGGSLIKTRKTSAPGPLS